MDLPQTHKLQCPRRRGCYARTMNFHILLLLGLWISNTILSCAAMPQPKPQTPIENNISKQNNDDDFNENVAVELGAPLIIPLKEEIILEENTDYTIRCEDSEDVVWKYPRDITAEENTYKPEDQKRRYGLSLTLKEVSYLNVANYYCVKASALKKDIDLMEDSELNDLANNNLASSIYIFVNDKNHLLAPIEFPATYVVQFQDAVIPCRPTMPHYDVLLTTPKGSDDEHSNTTFTIRSSNVTLPISAAGFVYESLSYNPKLGFRIHGIDKCPSLLSCVIGTNDSLVTTYSSNTGIRYNPRLGFVLQMRDFDKDNGEYICRPKIPAPGNEEEQTQIDIILGNKIIHTSLNTKQLDKASMGVMEPTLNIKSTTTTTTTASASTTTKPTALSKSLVTNHLNVTNNNSNNNNSISLNLTLKCPYTMCDNLSTAKVVVESSKPNKNQQNFNNNGVEIFSINIRLRLIGDGYNASDAYNSIEHDSDDNGGDVDSDEYNSSTSAELETIYENHLSLNRPQRERRDLSYNSYDLNTNKKSFVPYYTDYSFESLETKLAPHIRETRQATTRRPSHHYRSTTYTTHVDKPNITSTAKHHAPEGGTFELICDVKIAHDVKYKIEWILPDGVERDVSRFIEKGFSNINVTDTHVYSRSILTVKNAKPTDSGLYTCNVSDHISNKAKSSYNMLIVRKDESYIKMREPNDYYTIYEKANKTVQMSVRYSGYPWPKLKWYNPNGTEILNNHKFQIATDDVSSTLKISNARLWDTGNYTVEATNTETSLIRQFAVTIEDVPMVRMDDVYVHADEKAHLQCHVQSHQTALVTWVFEPCSIDPRWPSCSKEVIQNFNETSGPTNGPTPIDFVYDLYFIPKSPGIMRCLAINKVGRGGAKGHVLIRDINDNMTIYGIKDHDVIALDDKVTITCAALAYYFSGDINWYDGNGNLIEESENIILTKSATQYSYQKSLTFKKIKDTDQGQYECQARTIDYQSKESRLINITTHEPYAPRLTDTNLGEGSKIERKLGESVELICVPDAIPKATVKWYKEDELLANNETDNQSILSIPYLRPDDVGHYKCVVSNRLGSIEKTVNIKITNIPTAITVGWIAGILALLTVLIALVIYLYIRVKRERKLLRELKAAGLANFEEGAVEHINPALTLDEQADLLPYDRNFEFPREKLKLGKQLGAGAFGVVLKAHAEGIKPDEKESVVAVKMVKRQANNEVMRALVSELKIMVHLGQHLNVVNLLGAVTKNIAKRELMVIVEYCRYGNVQNFLMRNRKRFINQINPSTGKIDPTIMIQRFSDNFELNRDGLKYVNLSFSKHQYINHMNNINNMNNYYSINNSSNSENDPRSGTRAGRPNSTGYISQSELYEGQVNTCATEQTVMTTVPEDDDSNIMSNNSVQPAWRSNYKPDSTEAMAVTTTDLISWAFQVACGMEYLSSKKVLHGDLAARNILLCEDNIVKICDFGLARSIYKSDNYKKQGDAPLPIKWLALESLSDHIFSTYTDVWSYGIVLWELFSLAKVPYPEIDANQSLYLKLKDGYRMEKPPYANDDLYDIMLECWSTNPERRPLFNVLKERFAMMLGEEVTSHYVDLNEPYLRVNTEYMKRSQTDYLSLMGSPDEMAPPPPRYVNGHILPEIRIDLTTDDYLTMSPNGDAVIFSPTRPKDSPKTLEDNDEDQPPNISATSFQFPDNTASQHSPTIINNLDSPVNKPPRNKKDGIDPLPEEIPMLHNTQQNDESPEQSRKYNQILQQTRNVPTPSPRHFVAETKLQSENGDNYVNIKSPKKYMNNNGAKASEAFSNPSYQILKGGGNETK